MIPIYQLSLSKQADLSIRWVIPHSLFKIGGAQVIWEHIDRREWTSKSSYYGSKVISEYRRYEMTEVWRNAWNEHKSSIISFRVAT